MATKTKAQGRQQVAQMCGVTSVGQSISPHHATEIDLAWTAIYDELKDEELAIFPSAGPVPAKIEKHLVALIAMTLTETFGVSGERYNRIVAKNNIAKREIRKLVQPKYESTDDPEDF